MPAVGRPWPSDDDDDRPFYQQPVESIIILNNNNCIGYDKTHEMGKPTEVSMAKPIAPSAAELYGKTHDMGNPIGLLWQKPWDKNFNFKCWGAVSSR